MECFDNSHLSGTNLLRAWLRSLMANPKILVSEISYPCQSGGDDYGSMRNVLERRFKRAKKVRKVGVPDLLVVDGGRGQLNIARAVLDELDCTVPMIGISTENRA